mmetsp:Transcript_13874/g.30247  ORF Transcript_13874/g.30247 Transcript_13874/m.30247 type:complete len:235 (+) Transcript_13874:627-1331(+)
MAIILEVAREAADGGSGALSLSSALVAVLAPLVAVLADALLSSSSAPTPTLVTSLKTDNFRIELEDLLPNNFETLIAVISHTSSSSTAIILSPNRTIPTRGLSSRILKTYAGPESGGSGVTRTTPSFPEGAITSIKASLGFWIGWLLEEEAAVAIPVSNALAIETSSFSIDPSRLSALTTSSELLPAPVGSFASLNTVIFRCAFLRLCPNIIETSIADIVCTSSSSTDMILSSS